MNIILTEKDADSILSFLREELTDLTEFQNERALEFKKLTEDFKEDPSIHNNEHCIATYNETAEFYNKRMAELDKRGKDILHYIELLTCGSEVTK